MPYQLGPGRAGRHLAGVMFPGRVEMRDTPWSAPLVTL